MRPVQIEKWVLDILEQVDGGLPVEDSRVELKAQWIDAQKAARQLAGHSNAARGEHVLWIIGADEKAGVVGADKKELANWISAVESEFDGIAPRMTDLVIPYNGKVVMALFFEVNRAPFVVKNRVFGAPGGGPVEREVPWREGTRTRSATRSDLIRLLVPVQRLPELELRGAEFIVEQQDDGSMVWNLNMELYAIPMDENVIVVPRHWCECSFEIDAAIPQMPLKILRLGPRKEMAFPRRIQDPPPRTLSDTIRSTATEMLMHGPGQVLLTAHAETEDLKLEKFDSDALISISLLPVDADRSVVIRTSLRPFGKTGKDDKALQRWRL